MAEGHDRYVEYVLERIRDDRYPSMQLMDRVEAALASREEVRAYLDVLFEKLDDSRYPSKDMMDRVARLAYLT